MDKIIELTDEQKQQAKEIVEDQMTKLGEVFSQCWESKEFKKAFMEDPKAIFDEYEIKYDDNKNYKIIETPEKTMIHVLPYKGVKKSIKAFNDLLLKHVEDVEDDDAKQVLLEGWSWQLYQNSEDTYYIPIPLCPENLTPEELELVNGGCLIFVLLFVAEMEAAVTTTTTMAEIEVFLYVALAAAAVMDAAAVLAIVVAEAIIVLGTVEFIYTAQVSTGAWVYSSITTSGQGAVPGPGPITPITGPRGGTGAADPRKRGR